MNLFELDNGRVVPSIHALQITPFKEIWQNDITPNKEHAILLFTYTELLCSPKKSNPFSGYSDEERVPAVKKEVYGDPNKPITDFMILCTTRYMEELEKASPTFPLYKSAMGAADKLRKYLDTVDFDERTNSGSAVTKPADVTKALNDIPNVIKSLLQMREKVNAEIIEAEAKTRNLREVGEYER